MEEPARSGKARETRVSPRVSIGGSLISPRGKRNINRTYYPRREVCRVESFTWSRSQKLKEEEARQSIPRNIYKIIFIISKIYI